MPKQYLAHIDTLRALAVILVILHHLNILGMTGGFIGVDIFFVISGYLITKNIILEKNKFSFPEFYKSRIIRLAPGYFTVTIISVLFFSILLTPEENIDFYKSIIYANIFSINIYMYKAIDNYFSINSLTAPLMHYWSLAVEEQFYLIWPIVLFLITKIKKYSIHLIFIFLVIFLCVSQLAAISNPNAAYFLTQFRVFEFLIGCFLCFIPIIKHKNFLQNIFLSFSFFLIIYCALVYNKNTLFPGLMAFIPCLATACIIYFGQNISSFCKFFMQNTYIIKIGKISYPLYLWHWPIIVVFNVFSIKITYVLAFLIIFITSVLAIITYIFIEKPIKKLKIKSFQFVFKSIFLLPTLLVIWAAIIAITIIKANHPINDDSLNKKIRSLQKIQCIDTGALTPSPIEQCYLGIVEKKEIDFLLIGDSHANAQSRIIDEFASDMSLKGYEITQSSTIFLPDVERLTFQGGNQYQQHIDFRQRNDLLKNKITTGHYQYIVMGGFYPNIEERSIYIKDNKIEDSGKIFFEGLQNAIQLIINSGAKPVIIQDNPLLTDIDVNCILRPRGTIEKCQFSSPFNSSNQSRSKWNSYLNKLKDQFPQLIVIDFNSIICDKQYCKSSLDGIPLYRDNQHLTYAGASAIGKHYLLKYGNPLHQ